MTEKELIEQLAEKEHASWARWMIYLMRRCTVSVDGSMTISAGDQRHWTRQAETAYGDLSEREKQSDREEVALILPIIRQYVTSRFERVQELDRGTHGE